MLNHDTLFSSGPYALKRDEKEKTLVPFMRGLTQLHYENCREYGRILDALDVKPSTIEKLEDIPYLPVRLFKEYDLRSVSTNKIAKQMTSSGTTGQSVSRIYLDGESAALQAKALAKIVSGNFGANRLPMIILDSSAAVKDRNAFSARGTGIRGFSMFATQKVFAFDDDMKLNRAALDEFLAKHAGSSLLLFGFTFMIWEHFYKVLRDSDYRPDLSQGRLIHGGGWKRLVGESVTPERYKKALGEVCRLKAENIRDYYGMVEQAGTIHMECEKGNLHTSVYGDVIIRRHTDFRPVNAGETGVIQVLSTLPASYPGHSLLTEDEGLYLGEDNCPCGRQGKYFKVLGRLKNAELRGCSDTYEKRAA